MVRAEVASSSSSSSKAGLAESATTTLKGNRWLVNDEEGPSSSPPPVPDPAANPQRPPAQPEAGGSRHVVTPGSAPKGQPRSPSEPSLTSMSRGTWFVCLLPMILSVACIIAGATVLGIHGSGEDAAFRCDLAAVALSGMTFVFFIGLLVMEMFFNEQQVPVLRWLVPLQLILMVNAVGLLALALLAHATWALVQIFAVLAAGCWTVVCCWASAAIWRSGIPASRRGETNLMKAICSAPKISAMVCWVFFLALGYSSMYFKPADNIGFPSQITRFEHFIMLLVGGVCISCFCTWMALCLLPSGQRLLLRQGEQLSKLSYCKMIARSLGVAVGTHFVSVAFVAFTFNWVVTILAIFLTKLAVRLARAPLKEADLQRDDEASSIYLGGRVRKKTCCEKCREWSVTGLLVILSALRVVAVFMVFFFDVTFIQSYIMGTRQQDFTVAGSGLACGVRGDLLSTNAQDPAACTALAVDVEGADAFLFGVGPGVAGHCYAQTLQVNIDSYVSYRSATPQGNQSCPGGAGVWQDATGFDFYVMAPSCSISTRRLAEEWTKEEEQDGKGLAMGKWRRLAQEERTTVYAYDMPLQSGEAGGQIFGSWFHTCFDGYLSFLRSVFDFGNIGIPDFLMIRCTGFARLVSGCIVLGAVMIVVTLSSMDLLSIMSASNEITKIRAARVESFMEYFYMITKATLLQQSVLLLLQVTISWGAKLIWEARGVFAQHCGYLIDEDLLSGTACPNFWHTPMDIFASATLFLGILLGIVTFVAVMSGALYGLTPARWAVKAVFGQELQADNSVGVPADDEECRAASAVTINQPKIACSWSWFLRPFEGLGVCLGVWTTACCRNYQCGHRQDLYQHIAGRDADGNDDPRAHGELVDFKCIYEATSHNISMVWLAVPGIGAVVSKGAMYLNQYVIFAFGEDSGGTDRKPQRIITHFQEDTPRMVHILHWVLNAGLFAMMLAINCDFFGVQGNARLAVLSVCVAVVIMIAALRVAVDMVKEVRIFWQSKNLLRFCRKVIEDTSSHQEGVIAQVAKFDRGKSDVNPLKDLQHCERSHLARTAKACQDLLELSWVRERRLPPDAMSRLVVAKNSLGPQNRAIKRLLEQSDEVENKHHHAVLLAGTILYIHQAVYHEICAHRSRAAARLKAYNAAQEAARSAGNELEQVASAEARMQAAKLAASRVQEYQEARSMATRQQELRPVDGQVTAEPPELPRRLCLEFETHSKGTAKITAHLLEDQGGRELIEPQIAEVMVIVSGKVELTWPRDKDPSSFRAADVQVKAVRHQIVSNFDAEQLAALDPEGVEDVEPLQKETRGKLVSGASQGGQYACGLCRQEDKDWHCRCLQVSARKPNHAITSGNGLGEIWRLTDLGMVWESVNVGSSPLHAGSPSGGTCVTLAPQDSGGSCPSSYFRVLRVSPPPPQCALRDGETEQPSQDIIEQLEVALRESVNNPQTLALAAAFMSALGADRRHLGNEQADRCSRLMVVASKILRAQKKHGESARPSARKSTFEQAIDLSVPVVPRENSLATTAPVDMRISAVEALREALARDDVSSEDLSFAIERARRADVDPMFLANAEDKFRMLIAQQSASLSLIKATESRMIQPLREAIKEAEYVGLRAGDYPDRAGVGVLQKAKITLVEEERNVIKALKAAMKSGGALQLRRALQQVKDMGMQIMAASEADVQELIAEAETKLTATGEKKRLIALLKMAMTSGNAGLLKAAVEECARHESPDDRICLDQARKRLQTLEQANENFKEGMAQGLIMEASSTFTPGMLLKDSWLHTMQAGRPNDTAKRGGAQSSVPPPSIQQVRATAALRAALFQEPPELQMLQLAVKEAKQVRLEGGDMTKAEELIASLSDQERALDTVREAAAERDVGKLSAAIKHCHAIGVDQRKLLFAVQQLMEEQAKVARVAGDHGLHNSTLADLERERRELHNSILDVYGGLRCLCRIRPQASSDPPPLKTPAAPLFQRADRHTLLLAGDVGPPRRVCFSAVFALECIQAEVFNDLRSLAQSAVDGYNVLIMAGGPPGSGKTFSMYGEAAERRGIVPRIIDEIFLLRDRDSWRANLEVDAQLVEVLGTRKMGDLLSRGAGRAGLGPSVRVVPQGVGQWDAPSARQDNQLVLVDGAVTRRAASKHELKRVVQEAMHSPSGDSRSRHVLLLVTLTRTNRATGTMTRSKIALVDLAGLGQACTSEVTGSYRALEAVFKALANGDRRPPFRDHALTEVLQDCMGGSAKTVFLLNLPPPEAARSSRECMEAISFATCADW